MGNRGHCGRRRASCELLGSGGDVILSLLQTDPLSRRLKGVLPHCKSLLRLRVQEYLLVLTVQLLGCVRVSTKEQRSISADWGLVRLITVRVLLTDSDWPVLAWFHDVLVVVHDLVAGQGYR